MKYPKLLCLFALVAIGVTAFAESASATTLTDKNGGVYLVGTKYHASNVGNVVMDGTPSWTCKKSTLGGEITNAGGSTTTVGGHISTLTFEECGNNTVTVVENGSLEIHTDNVSADRNGTFTSNSAIITVLTHNILGTVHCIYVTSETDFGTLDGSGNTTGNATLTIDSVPIPRLKTDFACSSGVGELTGEYTFSTPAYIDVD